MGNLCLICGQWSDNIPNQPDTQICEACSCWVYEELDPFRIRAVWYGRCQDHHTGIWNDTEIVFEHGDLIEFINNDDVYGSGQVLMQWQDLEGKWHDFK